MLSVCPRVVCVRYVGVVFARVYAEFMLVFCVCVYYMITVYRRVLCMCMLPLCLICLHAYVCSICIMPLICIMRLRLFIIYTCGLYFSCGPNICKRILCTRLFGHVALGCDACLLALYEYAFT